MSIRVTLAEDSPLLRAGITRVLESADDIDLLGAHADLPALLDAIELQPPDVVVTDIRMPPTNTDEGIQAARRLRERHPEVGVVVLSQYIEPAYAMALLSTGSDRRAYLLKERVADVGELLQAVQQVAAGGSVVDPKVVDVLVSSSARRAPSDLERLTPRERDVLREMATGKSNAAIAANLVLSERAVEKHSNSIFAKLGLSEERDVNRRVKAVLLWLGAPDVE